MNNIFEEVLNAGLVLEEISGHLDKLNYSEFCIVMPILFEARCAKEGLDPVNEIRRMADDVEGIVSQYGAFGRSII